MVTFLVRHPMVFIFLNLFGLLECPIMLMTLTAKLLKQGYRYHKLCKAFSKFYLRNFDIVSICNVGLKTFILQAFRNMNFMATWCITSEKK